MTIADAAQWIAIIGLAIATMTNSASIRELIRHTRWKARR